MFYGFVITEGGNALLASMVAGQTLIFTRVVMDKGTAESIEAARAMTAPIDPGPEATSSVPTVDGNAANMIVEYRSDMGGGLQEGFWIGGFAIYGKVETGEETMIGYGSLGDTKQYVSAYVAGTAPDVRRYPISITVTTGVQVAVNYPAEAWMTAEDVAQYISGMGLDGDGYIHGGKITFWMGQACPGGPLKLDDIQGNTVLGGTPAYDAPVSMESVESPLKLHVAGKNLLQPVWNLDTLTQYGVTCTRNGDAFVLSGANSRGSSLNFYIHRYDTESAFSLPAGTYTLSGASFTESLNMSLSLYRRLPSETNESVCYQSVGASNGVSFTLSEDADNLFLVIVVGAGVTVDGVTITPQIEVGNEATGYEAPSNTTVEIPLLGTDGQELEPLRMSYIGRYGDGNRVEVPDRVVRKDGMWCVERNTAVADLTTATWGISANYLTPYFNSNAIRGQESHWVLCTHFPSSGANPSTVWTAGIWMGVGLVVNKESLPNGTATTPEEMAVWCAAQAEAGTPVRVIYTLKAPVYEQLHQDVQVLLNTLAVPGGVCSVWFEGDVLPSGADIGLPRGDYPSAGLAGAYRWLEELSNPLPTPTTADLYAWALEQQRGGVFATSGSTTTQNVPETGDLTGILSVTEQGSAVSMLVFGPTGKIHTATRIAGVWRGWTTLYSPLSKPTPTDLGAAAASHTHSTDQITSGILPLARGGLGASTWSAALDNLRGMARQVTYYSDASVDIDTITDGLALVPMNGSKGCPIGGSFVIIMQMFYDGIDDARNRTQIAFPYTSGNGIAVRTYNGSAWSEWNLVYTAKTPPPAMTGATSSAAGTTGLVPAPTAGAKDKYLRGDGTWQTPQDTTYDDATPSAAGLMSADDKAKLDGIDDEANNYTHPSYTSRSSGLYKIVVDGTGHISGAEATHTGRAARFVIGTSAAGWTAVDCDYLCDGTADDVEIKAAISALPSGGGEVLLLDGTYNISSSVIIGRAGAVLRGSGPGTIIKRGFNSNSQNGVVGCSAANCCVRDLTINGNRDVYGSDNNIGIYCSKSATMIDIDRVTVSHSYQGLIFGGISGGGRISYCTFTDIFIANTCISISNCKDIKIFGNKMSGIVSISSDCAGCIVSGNTVRTISLGGNFCIATGNILMGSDITVSGANNIAEHNVLYVEQEGTV